MIPFRLRNKTGRFFWIWIWLFFSSPLLSGSVRSSSRPRRPLPVIHKLALAAAPAVPDVALWSIEDFFITITWAPSYYCIPLLLSSLTPPPSSSSFLSSHRKVLILDCPGLGEVVDDGVGGGGLPLNYQGSVRERRSSPLTIMYCCCFTTCRFLGEIPGLLRLEILLYSIHASDIIPFLPVLISLFEFRGHHRQPVSFAVELSIFSHMRLDHASTSAYPFGTQLGSDWLKWGMSDRDPL